MDFFRSQETARQNTFKLIVLFGLAVLSIIVLTNFLVMVFFGLIGNQPGTDQPSNSVIFCSVGVGIVVLIAMGSLYKIMMLSGGGKCIAEQMSGELVVEGGNDIKKQRLLNIVEEMAIASGLPVPSVYVIPGDAINAFAAGHWPSDAVVGVSRGALKKLTRDEMQGVIAHEFSHILNGDMRMNIRLIGILHGILLIGLVGYHLLRFTPRSRDIKGVASYVALGIGLVVIGYGGTFFGNLIKAAVNRQREYLADSAAVQFTRNPDGIGRALIRIGAGKKGSAIDTPGSAEISHLFFCQGFISSFNTFFATHPPLDKRIRRILPAWDGVFRSYRTPDIDAKKKTAKVDPKERLKKAHVGILAAGASILSKDNVVEQVGRPTGDHVAYARQVIADLPQDLKNSFHSSYGAQAVIYSLVLDKEEAEREKQMLYLKKESDQGVYDEVMKQAKIIAILTTAQRLPLMDLAFPALRQLSTDQYLEFKKILAGLIASDNKVMFFEWTLQKIVVHHLDRVFISRKNVRSKEPGLKRAREAGTIIVSLFVNTMKQKGFRRQDVFAEALKESRWIDADLLESGSFDFKDIDAALNDLVSLKPRYKKMLIQACVAAVVTDKHVSAHETELLRAVSSGLDCPMPPIIL